MYEISTGLVQGGHNAVTQACASPAVNYQLFQYILVEAAADATCPSAANSYVPVCGRTALHFAAVPEIQVAVVQQRDRLTGYCRFRS